MKLGALTAVPLRNAWTHEATEFTPWLARPENLALLGEALGLEDLELVGKEHPVGEFKLDLLCSSGDAKVIIENQLTRTDHSHLGQLLAYAAGVGAEVVVWIAEAFRGEHVAALEFLNEHTTDELQFFGVKVELWRIGDSPVAPRFEVVARPNEWIKSGRAQAQAATVGTPVRQMQLRYWSKLYEVIRERAPHLRIRSPKPQHWFPMTLGRSGVIISLTVLQREARIGAELYMSSKAGPQHFDELLPQREAIEAELGVKLDWQQDPGTSARRILWSRGDSPLEAEDRWPEYVDWMIDKATRMESVFRPRVLAIGR